MFTKYIYYNKIYVMRPPKNRFSLVDGSIIDWTIKPIEIDAWRPHGVKYSLAWVQDNICRVLFDNHHGKKDHMHIDGVESDYAFKNLEQLILDFKITIRKLGGKI